MNFSKEMPLEQQNIQAVKTSREEEFANEIKHHLFNEFEIEAINSFLYNLNNLVKKELNQRIELLEAETSRVKLVLEDI
jgi:uncharacterized small protein (DUF1192 family)